MATFKMVDYTLRPNKNVERKLILESLLVLQPEFNLSAYRYIGLGGIWFVDFVLFHRGLRIRDMISIQSGAADAARADFNRPFNCVEVREGVSSVVLPRLSLKDKPNLLWLDYDSVLKGPIKEDIGIVCESFKSGDLALFTVNADHRQLANQKEKGGILREKNEVLSELLEIPISRIPEDAIDADGFPPFVAGALFDRMKSATRTASGGDLRFVPLFNFLYADGSTMITIGGMFVNEVDAHRLTRSGILGRDLGSGERLHPFVTGVEQFTIQVPLLTHREKLAFDQVLPREDAVLGETLAKFRDWLEAEEIKAYRQFYRYYPAFTEMAL
jgi:hypothetical protein